jgi:hypothetical protein
LIDDLINLARVTRAEMYRVEIDLSGLAQTLFTALHQRAPDRQIEIIIAPDLIAYGDFNLLGVMLANLLSNAWKFTSQRSQARIEVGQEQQPDGTWAFFVRDNGAGFDAAYTSKLFGAFQRLHSQQEFEGTGIGLATVQRIINRHGGRVWARGAIDAGAIFYFILPAEEQS